MRRRHALLLLLLLACAGSGCERAVAPPVFKGIDITGADYAHDFALTDQNGKARTLADFHGKVVVMFFGYTQCPDVCPTTMAELTQVLHKLGPDAARVQVLFVTLDPERDTAELLRQYVPAFDPRFLGLRAEPSGLEALAKEFHLFYQKVPGSQPGSYSLNHTAGLYVFDRAGQVRLFIRNDAPVDDIVADLRRLL
jgi:protein SCO1/2